MKKRLFLFFIPVLFACETSVKQSEKSLSEKTEMDPRVALDVLNDYVTSCNELKDPGKWVENQQQLSQDFKKDYKQLIKEAVEADPEMGLGFDPILNAQDYSEKGYEISSFDGRTGLVILQGIVSPEYKVKLRIKIMEDRCVVDGAGVIRMPEK